MTVFVYALFFEDPWDEYYEHKLHAVFSSQEKAEAHAKKFGFGAEWHIEKMSLDNIPQPKEGMSVSSVSPAQSFQLYEIVARKQK